MAVSPDAFQPSDAAPAGFQLHQSRPQFGAAVPQGAQQLVAGHSAAQLGTSQTAAGDNQLLALQGLAAEFQTKAFWHLAHFIHGCSQLYLNIRLFQGKAQHIHHRIGLVGIGIYPAGIFRHGKQPQMAEPFQGLFRREGFQGIPGKGGIFPMVAFLPGMEIA